MKCALFRKKISEQTAVVRKRKSLLFSSLGLSRSQRRQEDNFFRRLSFRADEHEREDVIGAHSPQIEQNSFTSLVFRIYSCECVSERARARNSSSLRNDILFCESHLIDTKKKPLQKTKGVSVTLYLYANRRPSACTDL